MLKKFVYLHYTISYCWPLSDKGNAFPVPMMSRRSWATYVTEVDDNLLNKVISKLNGKKKKHWKLHYLGISKLATMPTDGLWPSLLPWDLQQLLLVLLQFQQRRMAGRSSCMHPWRHGVWLLQSESCSPQKWCDFWHQWYHFCHTERQSYMKVTHVDMRCVDYGELF